MLIGMFKLTASQSVSHGPSRRSLMLFLLHRNTKPPNKPAVFLSFFSRLSRARARVKWLSKQQLRKERERERERESGREGVRAFSPYVDGSMRTLHAACS
jgi:hypothetical protein